MGLQVAVIGAGLMGHGIAQSFAMAGHNVKLFDASEETLKAAPERMAASLAELGQEAAPVLSRVELCASLKDAVRNSDVVMEAASENLALKRAIFAEASETAPPDALLGSNTSSIPITEIGRELPESARRRLVGIHWWFPPVLIPLVEIVSTEFLDPEYFERAFKLIESIGKEPVRVMKDVPGFIGNRLLHSLVREALSMVDAGICDGETIDKVVKSSFGRRFSVLGPMEGVDLVDLSLVRDVHSYLFPSLEKSGEPSPLLDRLIADGKVGVRSLEGVRKWTPGQVTETRKRVSDGLIEFARRDRAQREK